MRDRPTGKTLLSPVGFGAPFSYKLCGDHIVGHLFGFIPAKCIHLSAVHYLRLASRTETPPAYMLFNWLQFMPRRRSVRPVYVLQTRSRHRIFLKLDGSTHFKLRQAIGRHNERNRRMAA